MFGNEVSDSDIIKALQQGDEKALTEIFQRYWKRLYFMALRRTGTHEIAEEIVQDLFADLWDKRETLFKKSSIPFNLAAYLLTCVKNKTLNHIRSQVYKTEYFNYYKAVLPHDEKSTEQQVEFSQLSDALEKGIQQLPEKSATVFRLNRLEGRSVTEISNLLNLSEKAIEYHLTKSLKSIRFYLKDFTLIVGIALFC